jgi:hypothetical protein
MVRQIIDGRYLDRQKLMLLIQSLFPPGSCHVRVGRLRLPRPHPANFHKLQLNKWILSIPKILTEVCPPIPNLRVLLKSLKEQIENCCLEMEDGDQ